MSNEVVHQPFRSFDGFAAFRGYESQNAYERPRVPGATSASEYLTGVI